MLNRKYIKILVAITILFGLWFIITPLPDPVFDDPYATTLLAEDGTLLNASIADDMQWRFPPSDSLPDKFKTAIRLYEDEYFYYHFGVNPVSIVRAISQNIEAGEIVSGGSTLSMQTIRMSLGNKERTYWQKFVEVMATFKLELLYSKEDIMKTYADHAPFGGNIVGLKAASYRYYNRSPFQLSWAETAVLAVLPNHPASIFPGRNDKLLRQKRDQLLTKLKNKGILTDDELEMAMAEPLPGKKKSLPQLSYHLLHRAIKDGAKGTNIHSTLDANLQVRVNRAVESHSKKMAANHIYNAAAVVIEISSGKTLAYTGNSDNPGIHGQHVDVITALRSPGSLLKPILYASAIDEGLILPQQLLKDIPLFYEGFNPKNFNKKYKGAVPANEALTSSLNVPFVHLLIAHGHEKFLQKLKNVGFESFSHAPDHYGLSMILGGAETSLWEITSVYASLARVVKNYSQRPYKNGYSSSDFRSNHYLKSNSFPEEILSADGYLQAPSLNLAFKTMQKLERPEEESGWQYYGSSRAVSWKTGTSFGFRDGWAIGFDNEHLVGVWVGNADGEGRPGLTGVSAAAPLMFAIFGLLPASPGIDQEFGAPVEICANSGMLAGKHCEETRMESLPEYLENTEICKYHQLLALNEAETHRVNSSCYKVADIHHKAWFVLPPVQAWYYQQYNPGFNRLPPYMEVCEGATSKQIMQLIYPRKYARIKIPLEQDGSRGRTIFEAAHQNANAMLYWHLDNNYVGLTVGTHQLGISAEKGLHTITLIDDMGNEVKQRFEVVE